jgi:hypothetical protein
MVLGVQVLVKESATAVATLKKKKKRGNPEAVLQTHFFRWLFYRDKLTWHVAHAIPNGGSRHRLEANSLKLQGVKAGIPDAFIPYPLHGHHGLYIEFKIRPNKPEEHQIEMMERLRLRGYICLVCYSLDEAMAAYEDYVKGCFIKGDPC